MRAFGRVVVTLLGVAALWQALVWATDAPRFILPGPLAVAEAVGSHWRLLLRHGAVTAAEVFAGLGLGTLAGMASALVLTRSGAARRWLLPLLVATQAAPVFALAPLLTLWFGYGLASKIAMTTLVIYFPVAAAFYDGLRRADEGLLELARVMDARPRHTLFRLRLPAALPALGSGLRLAAVYAPIGAVIGEWVGASNGLGYLMLYANGRAQTDLMFAAVLALAAFAVAFHAAVSAGARRLAPWAPDSAI